MSKFHTKIRLTCVEKITLFVFSRLQLKKKSPLSRVRLWMYTLVESWESGKNNLWLMTVIDILPHKHQDIGNYHDDMIVKRITQGHIEHFMHDQLNNNREHIEHFMHDNSLHWWLQNERESGGSGGHQPPFPELWDNLPPTVQKIARQQHHLCSWGYRHQSGTELLPTHGPSPSRCGSLLWLNVLFAGNWGWRHREPFYLPYHEPALVIECQGHTCSFLLGTKPLWHWRKWKSESTSKWDPRPRYRPTGKCPLYRYETIGQLLHSEVGSNQVGCSCTWQRSLSCETNTGATEEVPAPYQGWRGCNHPTSNWPYQGHEIQYLVPRTTNWLSPLWSNTDHWPYAAWVCIVTGMSWWILHSRLVECSLRDNSWDLHSRIPARSGILLSDMM